jgi:PLD-like domain
MTSESFLTHIQAAASDNLVSIGWWTERGISKEILARNLLGYTVAWLDQQDVRHPLRAWVPFEGQSNPNWQAQTTDQWPIQGTDWFDFSPQPNARYQIAPVFGSADNPQVDLSLAIVSESVEITTDCGGGIKFLSNRGVISTQYIARKLPKDPNGEPSKKALKDKLETEGDPLRIKMAGSTLPELEAFFQRAQDSGGSIVGGIFEFTDKQVRKWALKLAKRLRIILGNAGKNGGDEENAETRKLLAKSTKELYNRFVKKGHIAHNKFWIHLDKDGTPVEVYFGSVNMTALGFCGQYNAAWIVTNKEVAAKFLEYWMQLLKDTTDNNSQQGAELRTWCQQHFTFKLEDGSDFHLFFSPNTSTEARDGKLTIPLKFTEQLLRGVKQSLTFGYFNPGHPSELDLILKLQEENPNLIVQGSVSDSQAMPSNAVLLYKRNGNQPIIVEASAFQGGFGDFVKELLTLGFAKIHIKAWVADEFGAVPIARGGSNNGGERADSFNDENEEIVIGNRPLAIKLAVFLRSIFRHFRERWKMQAMGSTGFDGFLKLDTSWIKPEVWTPGTPNCREAAFMAGAFEILDKPAYMIVRSASTTGDGTSDQAGEKDK